MKTELILPSFSQINLNYNIGSGILTISDYADLLEFTKSEITALRGFLNQLDLTD